MFTGIIEETGTVISVKSVGNAKELSIKGNKIMDSINIGDSIAVDGVCLTVKDKMGMEFSADLSEETLKLTTLSGITSGAVVNLERALRLDDRLGGHLVTGHIDGRGKIMKKPASNQSSEMTIACPKDIIKYVIKKGSIAVNGISLTVASCTETDFTVALIPLTLTLTNLGTKDIGDQVNLEADLIGKYVEKIFSQFNNEEEISKNKKLDLNYLKEHGFA
ncbi:MAG: riboflavin synthase subunit alpha [Candidatus Schekmanbacteria bacterium RBG_16_38_11]|uniref:Riboflavin synthase n=1 Tax=Candidatus Schekmanbacteria bacterium RBG_16_38_11 TaxID=1817880 RepID=A0A1F7RZ40_9BACT|nr:MAG: riboflavin synthase subunit alpha [Candidatus Schekmanbacteria bacterium RBG_16_38_11]